MIDDEEPIEGLLHDSLGGPAPDHPGAESLARLVTGEAGRKERAKTLDHVAGCDLCSRLLQSALRLSREIDQINERPGYAQVLGGSKDQLAKTKSPGRFSWRRQAMFASAALIGLIGVTYSIISLSDGPAIRRGRAEAQVRLISPRPGALFAAGEIQFRWAAVPHSAHYIVEIFGAALEKVWRSGPITETLLILPEGAGGALHAGGRYFWRLTAVLEDGRELISRLAEFSVQEQPLRFPGQTQGVRDKGRPTAAVRSPASRTR